MAKFMRAIWRQPALWLALLTLGSVSQVFAQAGYTLNPPPGLYAQDVVLNIAPASGSRVWYRFLSKGTADFLPVRGGLSLSSLEGETRSYKLSLKTEDPDGVTRITDVEYVIAKRQLLPPMLSLAPGVYDEDQTVRLTGVAGRVLYRLDESPWQEYAGQFFTLGANPEQKRTFRLEARTEEGGRSSGTRTAEYTIDKTSKFRPQLTVLSPAEGKFANRQYLFLETKDLEWTRYSLDGSDPSSGGLDYSGPVLLPAGALKVKIRAKMLGAAGFLKAEINLDSGEAPLPAGFPAGVNLTGPVTLPPVAGAELLAGEGKKSVPWQRPLELAAPGGGVQSSVVSWKLGAEVWRVVYFQDDRQPAPPVLTMTGGFRPQLLIQGAGESKVVFTLDGTEPGPESPAAPAKLLMEELDAQGATVLKAASLLPNGRLSPSVSYDLVAEERRQVVPDPQLLTAEGRSLPYGWTVQIPQGMVLIYELATEKGKTTKPGPDSPEIGRIIQPDLPYGMTSEFFLRFAFKDSQGRIGPSSAEYSVTVDRIPPALPQWTRQTNQVTFAASPDRVFYLLSEARVEELDPKNFAEVSGPIALPSPPNGGVKTVYLHYFALDKAGNPSATKTNVPLQLDGRNPGILGLRGFVQDGVTNQESLSLEPILTGTWDQVFYSLTLDGSEPQNPDFGGQTYTQPLSLELKPGEKRTIRTLWLMKKDNFVVAGPTEFRLTQDLVPPRKPLFQGLFQEKTLTSDLVIEGEPVEVGDRIFYTLTRDKENWDSPFGPKGLAWTGSLTLGAETNTKATWYLRLGVADAAGNTVEILGIKPFLIDRRQPAAPELVDVPPVFFSRQAVPVAFKPAGEKIYYSLTEGEALPPLPNAGSTLYQAPFTLEGRPGKSTVYHLRAVAVTDTGLSSEFSAQYTIQVDRTVLAAAESGRTAGGASTTAIVLDGLPASGSAREAVKLVNRSAKGLLRYEIASGQNTAPHVSPFSQVFPAALELKPGENEERSYVLALRLFDEAGQALGEEEVKRFNLDTLAPTAPEITVVLDAAQPLASIKIKADGKLLVSTQDLHDFSAPRFLPSPAEFRLVPRKAAMPGFRLKVQSVDAAGNVSPIVEKNILLEQNAIYASTNGTGDGSRDKPVAGLVSAVKLARASQRTLILLAAGRYILPANLDVSGLQISGGFGPDWDAFAVPQTSEITIKADYTGTTILSARRGLTILRNLRVAAPLGQNLTLLRAQGGDLVLDGLEIEGQKLDASTLMAVTDCRVYSAGLRLITQAGQGNVLLNGVRSSGQLTDVWLDAGEEKGGLTGLNLTGCDLKIDRLSGSLGSASESVAGLILKDTSLEVAEIRLNLNGASGNLGGLVQDSTLKLLSGRLNLGKAAEFNRLLDGERSRIVVSGLELKVGSADYVTGLFMKSCNLTYKKSGGTWQPAGRALVLFQLLGTSVLDVAEPADKLEAKRPAGVVFQVPLDWKKALPTEQFKGKGWKTAVRQGQTDKDF